MKKSGVILAVIIMGFSSFTTVNITPNKLLTTQINTLLDDLPLEIEEEILVDVKLKINHQNQIEVLTVAADDPLIRKLIKQP